MTEIRQPDVSITLVGSNRSVTNVDQRVLIVGAMISGTASAGTLVENIAVDDSPENALFGSSSQVAGMVRNFRKINQEVQVDVIPLADAAGTPRSCTITLVGTPTEAGTLVMTVGGQDHVFKVPVAIAETVTSIAAAAVVLINADGNCPYTATSVAGVITLVADNDGTLANSDPIGCTGTIAGITSTAVVQTVAGATDPVVTSALDVATERYQTIVWPWVSNAATVTAFLDARFNIANKIMDGVAIVPMCSTHALIITQLAGMNSQSTVLLSSKLVSAAGPYKGNDIEESIQNVASQHAATRSLRLTDGASIAQYVTSTSSLDQFGGVALASLPYFNTVMPNLPVMDSKRGWTATELEQLTVAGGATIGNNPSATSIVLGEQVTTYLTDAGGNADPTFGFLNYVDTASSAREYTYNNLRTRFAQSRLTNGNLTGGRDVANKVLIEGFLDKLFLDMGEPSLMLVESSEEAILFFKRNRTVALNLVTGTATITAQIPILTQLRRIAYTMKISFSTEG